MALPQDPFMLLSYVNTQLRDNYESLDDMCDSLDIDKQSLVETLAAAGFDYIEAVKQFK
ncbi:MAG: DUF4250 domain-containing protein [Bacteroidales bacterium]|nr:DUF4250 domain-containing protein [Bacteroidales bacterium]